MTLDSGRVQRLSKLVCRLSIKVPAKNNQPVMVEEVLPAVHGQPPAHLLHLYAHHADAPTPHYWRAQAAAWKVSALYGDALAAQNVGVLLLRGEQGVPKEEVEAVKFFRLAAEGGLADSMFHVGWAYASGVGTPQDWVLAVRWWKSAAEAGHASAARNLGLLYFSGIAPSENTAPCEPDYATGLRYYTLSADLGNYKACFAIADAYMHGRGVPKSTRQAQQWQERGETLLRRASARTGSNPQDDSEEPDS